MPEQVTVAQQLSIRAAGYDEYWLQDQIVDNPAALGLGELDALDKERHQSSGGRLDLLLKNPEDDSMYEVEIMLGETDETHIIRTIEYWDNEKRRWPQRQHFAVLVAEHINRRFFNVIHLLSHSIPIIAIQVSLIRNGAMRSLFFSTVLDTYQEVDDGTSLDDKNYNRDYWIKKAKWTLETADALASITQDIFEKASLNYVKNYISISVGRNIYLSLRKRGTEKSLLRFRVDQSMQEEVASLLDSANISYVRKLNSFAITVDVAMIETNQELFVSVARLVQKSRDLD